MKTSKPLLLAILVLFFMLWAPLGQFEFLVEHWMKIGTYAIPFMGIVIFAFNNSADDHSQFSNLRFLAVILLIAYILHQFEEHWVDLFGNYYAFYAFNNNFILNSLGKPDASIKPLTKESIFVINTSLVWLVGLLALLRSPKHTFPLIAMVSIVFINGIVHVLAGLVKFQYNPGLLTSIVLFIPLYFWALKQLRNHIKNYKAHIIVGLVWALLAHIIMVAGLLLANWFRVIPEFLYWLALVIWSITPIAILRKST